MQAIAVDYDGTLTTADRPDPDVLAAVVEARAAGVQVVLVTGRILSELREVLPEVDGQFDAIVAENGAVVTVRGGGLRRLGAPVPASTALALHHLDIPFRRGTVLLATQARYDRQVMDVLHEQGIECQLMYNRSELMVLPSHINKGTGLVEALDDLGVSPHNAIGVGDAENDHSLLDACEVGAAVANAIDSLRVHADMVLDGADGAGVSQLLRDLAAGAPPRIQPRRWQVALGTYEDGTAACIPASRVSLLIHGESCTGKSYLAGLLAEGLLDLDYTLCVIDFEGDHVPLGDRRGVITVGGSEGLVPVEHVTRLVERRLGSVVVDLSLESGGTRARYARALISALLEQRALTGLPHWVIVDEAHVPLGRGQDGVAGLQTGHTGLCLVTWLPENLCAAASGGHDFELEVRSPKDVVLRRPGAESVSHFRLGRRHLPHVRHWHKYTDASVAPSLAFRFATPGGATGRTAANLTEFHRQLEAASEDSIFFHAHNGDFSRWISDVFRDPVLAARISRAEAELRDGGSVAAARAQVMGALERRYLTSRGSELDDR